MDINIFNRNLKSIFWEIIRGSSPLKGRNNQIFYIKHLGSKDAGILESQENYYYLKAKNQGIKTNKEKLEELKEAKLYSDAKEEHILRLKSSLSGFKSTRRKVFLTKDLERLDKQIKNTEEEIIKAENEKVNLLGLTCESYANRRMNEFYIYYSVYEDEKCEKLAFELEKFEDLDQEELYELIEEYGNFSEKFSSHNLKRIAVNNFFLNYFYLCDDRANDFYGKSVVDLTFYQVELFGTAIYFKNLMSNSKHKHPEEYGDDVDKIIDWYVGGENLEKLTEDKAPESQTHDTIQATSIMGATKQDLKKIQEMKNAGAIDLLEEAKKRGGSLSFQDMLNLHNVK